MVGLHIAQITQVKLRIVEQRLREAEDVVVHQLEVLVLVNGGKQNPGLLLWMINFSILVIDLIEIQT